MRIRLGYELIYKCAQETPMILTVSVHYSRASDILTPDYLTTEPAVPIAAYRDGFGNWCTRLVAPIGKIQIRGDGMVKDSGQPDIVAPSACQHQVQDLPEETLVFLLGSRYCETDRLSDIAWNLFGQTSAIRNNFRYKRRSEKGIQIPGETIRCRQGSCRDFALLMMEAARALGLSARFVSGYIFVPDSNPEGTTGGGATHAWMQAYLPGAGWVDFDPTNNIIGNRNLIRVAVAWDPKQALPLWGTFDGPASAFLSMDVSVSVTEGFAG